MKLTLGVLILALLVSAAFAKEPCVDDPAAVAEIIAEVDELYSLLDPADLPLFPAKEDLIAERIEKEGHCAP